MDIGAQAIAIWARLWAKGEPALMNQILDNPQLFNGYEKLVKETRCALVPGGKFDDVVANLELRGQSETAGELAALGRSEGASSTWMLIRCFDRLVTPGYMERIQQVMLRMMDGHASVINLKNAIDEIMVPAIDLYPAPEDNTGYEEANMGDRNVEIVLPEPIVKDLIYPGVLFLGGVWKMAQKTTFTLGLTTAIHNGLPFLGRATRRMRCAWLQKDMPLKQLISWGRDICDGMGYPDPDGMMGAERVLSLARAPDREWLSGWIRSREIEFLVIDSLRSVLGIADENDSAAVSAITRGYLIDEVRNKLGCTVLVLAHPSRHSGSVIRGSGDFEAAADSILKATPKMDGERVTSVQLYGRGRHPDVKLEYAIDHLEAEGGGIRIREVLGGVPAASRTPDLGERIVAILEQRGEEFTTSHDIADAIGGARNKVKEALGRLLSSGQIEGQKTPDGKVGKPGWMWRKRR